MNNKNFNPFGAAKTNQQPQKINPAKELWNLRNKLTSIYNGRHISKLSDEEKKELEIYQKKMVNLYDEHPELISEPQEVFPASTEEIEQTKKEGLVSPENLDSALVYHRKKIEDLERNRIYPNRGESDFLRAYHKNKIFEILTSGEKYKGELDRELGDLKYGSEDRKDLMEGIDSASPGDIKAETIPGQPKEAFNYVDRRKGELEDVVFSGKYSEEEKMSPAQARSLIRTYYNPKILELMKDNPDLKEDYEVMGKSGLSEKIVEAEKKRLLDLFAGQNPEEAFEKLNILSMVGKEGLLSQVPINSLKGAGKNEVVSVIAFTSEEKNKDNKEITYGFRYIKSVNKEYQGLVSIDFQNKEVKVVSTVAPAPRAKSSEYDYLPENEIARECLSSLHDFIKAHNDQLVEYKMDRLDAKGQIAEPNIMLKPGEKKEHVVARHRTIEAPSEAYDKAVELFNSLNDEQKRSLGLPGELSGDMIYVLYRKGSTSPVNETSLGEISNGGLFLKIKEILDKKQTPVLTIKPCYVSPAVLENPHTPKRPQYQRLRDRKSNIFTEIIIKPGGTVPAADRNRFLEIQNKLRKKETITSEEKEIVINMVEMVNRLRPMDPEYFRQLKNYPVAGK